MEQAPLEKQLVQIDLKGGVNERGRPETAPSLATLTRVENLVQNQTGSLVHRPGTTVLGSTDHTDDASSAMQPISRLVRTPKGLCALSSTINNGGPWLYQYNEGLGKFRIKTTLPDVVVTDADTVVGSANEANSRAVAVATTSKYHAILTTVGTTLGAADYLLSVYDRNTGCVAAQYSIRSILGFVLGGSMPKLVFVQDRYLVFFGIAGAGTDLYSFSIDTNAVLPAAEANITPTVLQAGVSGGPYDVATSAARAFVSFAIAGSPYIMATDVAGVEIEREAIPLITTPFCYLSVNNTNLWYTNDTEIGARLTTTLATVVVAEAPSGAGNTVYGFCVDANDVPYIVVQTTPAFGSTTITKTDVWRGTSMTPAASLIGTLLGWRLVSHPFRITNYGSILHNVLMHVCKEDNTLASGPSPHVLVNITEPTLRDTYYTFPVACSLEPYNGMSTDNGISAVVFGGQMRYLSQDTYGIGSDGRYSVPIPIQVTARSIGFSILNVFAGGHRKAGVAQFGGQTQMSGGVTCSYDGDRLVESGFVDLPKTDTVQGAAGAMGAGAYKYLTVFRYSDAGGGTAYSRISNISSVTIAAAKKVDVVISPCCVTRRDFLFNRTTLLCTSSPRVTVECYRTKIGGTQYYLCASNQIGTPLAGLLTQPIALTAGYFTVSDNLTDAQLALQPLLYRQPGTANSPVDRYPPPSGNIIIQHKDRLFTTDPSGQRVYYSSFFVDGESAWYNPVFSFYVHGGSGPITGLVSMDGRLFVFKRDGIFVVDGDGPSEGGVVGNEYSPPQRLATEYGCIDHRSIVVTTEGIVYRSPRGIELLTRSLQVRWVGDRVQNTVDANVETCGAALDSFGRVHILVAATAPVVASDAYGGATVAGISGAELVWDIPADAWSIHYMTGYDGVYGRAMQDVVMADVGEETLFFADPKRGIVYANDALGTDNLVYAPWVLETGWIRTGQQARQRFSNILFLAKKRSGANHAIKVSVAYNYVDSYTQTHTFEPGVLNALDIEELLVQPNKQPVLAVRVKIEEQAPASIAITSSTDATPIVVTSATHGFVTGDSIVVAGHTTNVAANGTWVVTVLTPTTFSLNGSVGSGAGAGSGGTATYPVGTGLGCDVLGITLEVAAKTGTPKLAAGQKA